MHNTALEKACYHLANMNFSGMLQSVIGFLSSCDGRALKDVVKESVLTVSIQAWPPDLMDSGITLVTPSYYGDDFEKIFFGWISSQILPSIHQGQVPTIITTAKPRGYKPFVNIDS